MNGMRMSFDPDPIRAVLFDIDGTLSDTDDLYAGKLARWFQPWHRWLGGRDPLAAARRLIMRLETPVNELYEWLDRLYLIKGLYALSQPLRELVKSKGHFVVIPGIHELLESLHAHYPLAVVTSRGERGTYAFLRQFDLEKYFQVIVTAQSCRKTKPHPQPLLLAAAGLQVDISSCVMVGDTTVDVRAGKAAGCRTVAVLCGFGEKPELQQAGADVILERTPDLATILRPQWTESRRP